MRILLLSDTFDPQVGGVQRVVKDLSAGLLAEGHAVHVGTRHREDAPESEILDGVSVSRFRLGLPAFRPRALVGFLRQRPRAVAAYGGLLREFRPDLVHVHFLLSPLTHLALARFGGEPPPLVVTAHGRDVGEMYRSDWMGRRLVNAALGRAAALTAPSEATLRLAAGLEPAGQRRIEKAVTNMLPRDFAAVLEAEPASCEGDLLAVGELSEKKGFDLLIRALATVPAVRVRIAGDGPMRGALEALAEKLGLHDRVEFLGPVPRERLPGLYRSSMALVVPSRTEPFGLVILEAFAAGLPVVATRVDGIPEVVGTSGAARLVAPEGLAEAIREVARDPEERVRMGAAGRARAREFTVERMVAGYLDVYRSVLGGASR